MLWLRLRVETGPPKRTDEPRAAHGRTRAGCRRMRAERDGTRLLPIGFASCFLSGSRAASYRVCKRLIGITSWLIGNTSWL
ncbi:hypothetical protein DY000_02023403 [Brassica cretica]|uniref:Uncharacterized protein n=1 Tax=Brassica cretica TaxID=69181 RepID=A0ABQ7E1A2_BRACR|nr:hypothetical protein DY000_02023403 [Brassica cretica]